MDTFSATYQIQASSPKDAEAWIAAIAREQTIECIDEGVPHQWILDELKGKVRDLKQLSEGVWSAAVDYDTRITGNELPQLLNVLYGNTSIHVGVKLIDIAFSDAFLANLPGPQFGVEGIRRLTGRKEGPLICTVLKPMGQSSAELAELAYQCALGGADMIKDDHSLSMQEWSPFRERVAAIAKAVEKANTETCRTTLYAASMLSPIDQFEARARFAVDAGVKGFLVMPGHTSWDSIRFLASRPDLSRPIMCHPSGLGSLANSDINGMTHRMMYAAYPRLCGADVSIYPSFGGRYGFSRELCIDVANACRDTSGGRKPILPSPGGGMRAEIAKDLFAMYGDDALYLFGGAAMQYREEIANGIRKIRNLLS